jgi:pyruvate/2-oxoglutarate dehydrogenase complex dihydrolipoamide dehydrogenase (E3) component
MQQANDGAAGLMRVDSGGRPESARDNGGRPSSGIARDSETAEVRVDLCVIGGGSGGLSVAAAAAQLGVSVALVEKHRMGGDCLNYGCVPSKALLAAARRAHLMRSSAPFGIMPVRPTIDAGLVCDHVHDVIAAIAPNDSVERFTGMGVRVINAPGHFITRNTVLAGDLRIRARRFVIATGSSPVIPQIPGLDRVPYFTNETIFDNRETPEHLIVIGAGPVGLELAQAYLRLGSRVTVLEARTALGGEDPELAQLALRCLRTEGLDIREGVTIERVSGGKDLIDVHVRAGDAPTVLRGTHLLLATGRKPNVAGLNLEAAAIKYDAQGVRVNKGLKTSNGRVFAIGDVIGGPQFTHVANYHAGIVLRRALFRLPARVDDDNIPRVTFTDPEVAYTGLSEDAARARHRSIRVFRWPYQENDRAQAERTTEGFVKIVTDGKGKIVGAGIVGAQAGELIHMWVLALAQGLNIKAMAQWISPYPTLSEINKRTAYGYYATAAASPLVRTAIKWLAKLG